MQLELTIMNLCMHNIIHCRQGMYYIYIYIMYSWVGHLLGNLQKFTYAVWEWMRGHVWVCLCLTWDLSCQLIWSCLNFGGRMARCSLQLGI